MAFAIGDIVHLKSGGPKMTVTNDNLGGKVATSWFAGAKLEHGAFPPNALEAVVTPLA